MSRASEWKISFVSEDDGKVGIKRKKNALDCLVPFPLNIIWGLFTWLFNLPVCPASLSPESFRPPSFHLSPLLCGSIRLFVPPFRLCPSLYLSVSPSVRFSFFSLSLFCSIYISVLSLGFFRLSIGWHIRLFIVFCLSVFRLLDLLFYMVCLFLVPIVRHLVHWVSLVFGRF